MTWNPLKVWRERKEAAAILTKAGFTGSIVDAATSAVDMLNQQRQAMEIGAAVMGETKKTIELLTTGEIPIDQTSATYFIPYNFEFSEFHNGGKHHSGMGMGMVTVAGGGINNWDKLMGVREFIRTNYLNPEIPNLKVFITGIFEVDRCKTPQPEPQSEAKTNLETTPSPSAPQ